MPMTPEQRRAYNQTYYRKNRGELLEKALQRVCCKQCNREVSASQMTRHEKSKLCYNTQLKIYQLGQRVKAMESQYGIFPAEPEPEAEPEVPQQ